MSGNHMGAVYFMTNATQGKNEIVMLQRGMDGALGLARTYATGGSGAGKGPEAPYADPLGSQGSIAMSDAHGLLFAVNAGSNDISTFRVQPEGLTLLGKVDSGGIFPVSLAAHGDWLYVLNAGGDGTLMGYTIQGDGMPMPIQGSRRSLNYGGKVPPYVFEAPGQIDFSPDGPHLIVVEKGINPMDHATNKIHVFDVDMGGMVSAQAQVSVSNGVFPFASAFTPQGHLLVVEAFGKGPVLESTGAVTSYTIDADGCLQVISGSVDSLQKEACWIAVASPAPYAYVANFGSHAITGYRVGMDGRLERLDMDGATARTGDGSHPLDIAASPDGRYLYALLPGHSEVGAWRIGASGSLELLGAAKGDWPVHMQGIVVR